jgi:hypothetical protein
VFARQAEELRTRLGRLEEQVAVGASAEAWDGLLSVSQQADRVAEELLILIEGSLARAAELDRGLCNVIDRLLAGLARSRYGLLGANNSSGCTRAD